MCVWHVRVCCVAGHHLPANDILDHMIFVLGDNQLGAWLGTDYSMILLQQILALPHYVINMSGQKWEGKHTCLVPDIYN